MQAVKRPARDLDLHASQVSASVNPIIVPCCEGPQCCLEFKGQSPCDAMSNSAAVAVAVELSNVLLTVSAVPVLTDFPAFLPNISPQAPPEMFSAVCVSPVEARARTYLNQA